MYDTTIICTYNTNEIFETTDKIADYDKKFIRDAIYRQELLNIFGIEEFNEKEIDDALHDLYEKIKDCKELKECILKLCGDFMSSDEELGLMFLFSYDYMYISHICICEFLATGKISQDSFCKLKTLIF
jgi:hypothetical protein